jgi:hypothetical protein
MVSNRPERLDKVMIVLEPNTMFGLGVFLIVRTLMDILILSYLFTV